MKRSTSAASQSADSDWIDDMPACKNTGVGYSVNQIYRDDGRPQEEHPYEDCVARFVFGDESYFYSIFDGHGHQNVKARYFQNALAAELCMFSALKNATSDESVKELLKQTFSSVETGYMKLIDNLLAERTRLQYDIPDGLSMYEVYQQLPAVVERIDAINTELSCGAAAAVALIHKGKLYVANVGNCRVLLCKTDANSVLKVVQLSVDHDLRNSDELLRLEQIGIKRNSLRNSTRLGNQSSTRCLGNYLVKGGYKEFEDLSSASQEPVIAEPDIYGGIELDDSCRFLLIMTSELYKCFEEATGTDQVNKYIAQCVVEQFREQATLTSVAQAVVDKAVRLHHDWVISNSEQARCVKREDITLVLRNFNFPLPNGFKSPNAPSTPSSHSNTLYNTDRSDTIRSSLSNTMSTNRTQSMKEIGPDGRVRPYVDFTLLNQNVEVARQKGLLPHWWD